MVSKVLSGALKGIDGYMVEVEVDISQGLPSFDIVGLPDSAVRESRERVKSAIKNTGINFPIRRLTVNLAPADTRKEGPSFDLPIAIGILKSLGIINKSIDDYFFIGELSLDGGIRHVKGILPLVHDGYKNGIKNFIIPFENINEASLIEGANIYGANSIEEIINHFNGKEIPLYENKESESIDKKDEFFLDFADVKGQENVKRALEISCAGLHNIIMIGSPGSGKTMMAKRIPYIMPDLWFDESIEVTKIYSISGLLSSKNHLVSKRPFRDPHHTISYAALVGGGAIPRPGEISLAHKGVLFLDELPEFQRNVLEVLRQPLEDKKVNISRAAGNVSFPSDFLLVAAMNPCPCGNLFNGDTCTCSYAQINRYLSKISGPLLDRIDIHVETSEVNYDDIVYEGSRKEESSKDIKKRIIKTQKIQEKRYKDENIKYNSQLGADIIEKYCKLDSEGNNLLKNAFDTLGLSVRAYHKILKVSRSIADLEGEENISPIHLSEAIQYRSLDRKYW